MTADAATHTKNWIDIATNASDLFSFLLVTTDLYGRERLAALSIVLLTKPRPALNPFDFWRGPGFFRDYLKFMAFAGVAMGIVVALQLIKDEHWRGWWLLALLPPSLVILLVYGGLLVSAPFWAGWYFLQLVGHLIRWLVQHYKVEGTMLLFGTVLFILTRAINLVLELK
jgi:hypothetical protein